MKNGGYEPLDWWISTKVPCGHAACSEKSMKNSRLDAGMWIAKRWASQFDR
jgi:hypothetical protein